MSYPVTWWKNPYFYPIGNSPPACLTQDLAPEQNAQILLLGCGDPRNILHTIHASLGDGKRTLDFTCCDTEPAVLARNVLLLAMIADGVSYRSTWRIFYHFFLDSDTLQVFLSQCRTLVQACSDLTTWNASTYGKYLRFCTERSMLEIRGHWEHYLSVGGLPEPEKRAMRKSFTSSMKEALQVSEDKTGAVSAYRSSAFHAPYNNAQNDLFRSFWSTGIMKGRFPHPPAPCVNPMFTYSLAGPEFNVDTATYTPAAFHLAPVLVQGQRLAPIGTEDIVDAVTTQFSNWCKSFHMQINTVDPSITIRFFAGDCFLFCKALRKFQTTKVTNTGIYARPWGLSQVNFTTDYSERESSPAPSMFNIIETSNLADHLGLLNILLITVPLLQPNLWSTLHTNTVQDPTSGNILPGKLFADVATLSLFLGVAPVPYLSDFSTHSSRDTIWSLSWKYPSSVTANKSTPYTELDEGSHIVVCDELQLGQLIYSVYTQMFAEEDMWSHILKPTPETFRRHYFIQYTRASFVEFLSLVHGRVRVDWAKAVSCFLRLVDSDEKLALGHKPNYYDLTCQLYLTNLAFHNDLRWSSLRDARSPGDPFEGWDRVPPVVSVTLKVPREHLKILEDMHKTELETPIFFCMTGPGPSEMNMHSSIRPTFGDVVVAGHYQDAQVVIHEDQAGWQGTSSLIVSFDAPAWMFTKAGGVERISLNVRSNRNVGILVGKLGNNELSISIALVTDNKHVWITRFRPNESQDICRLDSDDSSPGLTEMDAGRKGVINVNFHAFATANSLTLRHTIEDQDVSKTLADGVAVSTKAVADTVILVSFPGYEQLFKFPFPINGDKIATRIARKSSYIELVAPIRRDPETFVGLSLNPFPIARTITSFNLLNVHYINLSKMPAVDLPISKENLQWLRSHLEPDKERNSRATDEKNRVYNDLRKSVLTIFLGSSGIEKKSTIFELSNPTIGVYAVIFVNGLKLDLSERQTIVVDACVVPLNEKNSSKVIAMLRRGSQRGVTIIHTSDAVMEAWKALLPAVAERCRTWQHGDRCEYRERGIPACDAGGSWDMHASPLCGCGLGKDLGEFASLAAWKGIQSEATRVAFAPLFSFLILGRPSAAIPSGITRNLGRTGGSGVTLSSTSTGSTVPQGAGCGYCRGPGQPILLVCSRCKKMSYCSQKCQKAHWRTHKPGCIS